MATMLLLPILNKKVSTFRGPPWYISDRLVVETIRREDYALISGQQLAEVNAVLAPTSKCIRLDDVDPAEASSVAESEATKIDMVFPVAEPMGKTRLD